MKQKGQIYVNPKYKDKSNEDLMILAQKDNQEAFGTLYDRYSGAIYNYCLQMLGQAQSATELSHETFLKAYRARKTYRQQYKFTTWLWTIARNTTLDYLRKKEPLKWASSEGKDEEDLTAAIEDQNPQEGEQELIKKSEKRAIELCLSSLKGKQREALTLRIMSEFSYQEVADVLEITMASVKTLINRGKKAMLNCLKGALELNRYE